MKNLFLLIFLLFQLTFAFGQERDEVGHIVGPWTKFSTHSCYKGIQWRIRRSYYGKSDGAFINEYELKNNYTKKVSFSFRFTADNETETNSRKTLNPGESSRNVVLQNESRAIRLALNSLCFEYYNSNGTILENCSSEPSIYNKDYYYAECDNGSPNYKKYSGGDISENKPNSQSNTQNNQTSNLNQSIDDQIDNLMQERAKACECNNVNGSGTSLCGPSYTKEYYLRLVTGTENQQLNAKKNTAFEIRNDISSIKAAIGSNCTKSNSNFSNQDNALKQEEQRKLKLAEENNENFEKYIQAGDNDMNSNNYSSALSNYQSAKSYASSSSQKSIAEEKYNKALKEKEAAARKKRTDDVAEKDKNENLTYASTTAAMVGLMALVEDETSDNFISGRLQLGLGLDNIPLITNSVSPNIRNKSYLQSSLHPTFYFGFNIGIAETKQIFGNINPFFTAGLNALSAGTTGGHITYGCLANFNFKPIEKSIFGAYFEGGLVWKSGHLDYDFDAAQDNTTQTDDVRSGEYSYSTMNYGGGFMLHNARKSYYWYLKLGAFYDKADFMNNNNSSILNFKLQILDSDIGKFEFIYAPNSYIGGNAQYPNNLAKENLDFFMLRFVRQGKLW